jgi:hypothetical protein
MIQPTKAPMIALYIEKLPKYVLTGISVLNISDAKYPKAARQSAATALAAVGI